MQSTKIKDSDYFRSSRLLYRAIESPQDDETFHELHKNSETYRDADPSLPVPPSRKRTTFLRQFYQQAMLGVLICVINEDNDDGKQETPVGALSLSNTGGSGMAYHRNVEVTISIAPAFQNKGYGTEAIQWALDWAFRKANLHRVALKVTSYNDGAVRYWKNLGFRVESVEEDSIWHDNEWHGVLGMAMLEREWETIRKNTIRRDDAQAK